VTPIGRGLAATLAAAAALAALAVLVVAGAATRSDQYAVDHWMPRPKPPDESSGFSVVGHLHPHFGGPLETFCNVWTYPASAFVSALVLAGCAVVLVRRGRRLAALAFAAAWVVGVGLELVGKGVLERPILHYAGPTWTFYLTSYESSFPSGHALRAVVLAAVLAAVWRRAALPALVWLAVVLPALVLNGAHTPSDVLGGALLGLLVVAGAVTVLRARMPVARGAPLRLDLRSAVADDR
jgi:membrane-associated phospholipid phosphatase